MDPKTGRIIGSIPATAVVSSTVNTMTSPVMTSSVRPSISPVSAGGAGRASSSPQVYTIGAVLLARAALFARAVILERLPLGAFLNGLK